MLRKLLLLAAALMAAFLIYVAVKPAAFHVEREASIAASPEAVFREVNDFHRWQAWSPWAKRDPNAKIEYGGPDAGVGALLKWSGNEEVGVGQMSIVESRPGELVRIKLEFSEPFEGASDVGLAFRPEGTATRVVWSIDGEQGFIERVFCTALGLDMDQMIGADYEAGLKNLKAVVEGRPPG